MNSYSSSALRLRNERFIDMFLRECSKEFGPRGGKEFALSFYFAEKGHRRTPCHSFLLIEYYALMLLYKNVITQKAYIEFIKKIEAKYSQKEVQETITKLILENISFRDAYDKFFPEKFPEDLRRRAFPEKYPKKNKVDRLLEEFAEETRKTRIQEASKQYLEMTAQKIYPNGFSVVKKRFSIGPFGEIPKDYESKHFKDIGIDQKAGNVRTNYFYTGDCKDEENDKFDFLRNLLNDGFTGGTSTVSRKVPKKTYNFRTKNQKIKIINIAEKQ